MQSAPSHIAGADILPLLLRFDFTWETIALVSRETARTDKAGAAITKAPPGCMGDISREQ